MIAGEPAIAGALGVGPSKTREVGASAVAMIWRNRPSPIHSPSCWTICARLNCFVDSLSLISASERGPIRCPFHIRVYLLEAVANEPDAGSSHVNAKHPSRGFWSSPSRAAAGNFLCNIGPWSANVLQARDGQALEYILLGEDFVTIGSISGKRIQICGSGAPAEDCLCMTAQRTAKLKTGEWPNCS